MTGLEFKALRPDSWPGSSHLPPLCLGPKAHLSFCLIGQKTMKTSRREKKQEETQSQSTEKSCYFSAWFVLTLALPPLAEVPRKERILPGDRSQAFSLELLEKKREEKHMGLLPWQDSRADEARLSHLSLSPRTPTSSPVTICKMANLSKTQSSHL